MSPQTLATKIKREEIVQQVAHHLVTNGFEDSGVRALAASAGISDRMLMYYFDTKEQLISQALKLLATGISKSLDTVLPRARATAPQIVAALTSTDHQSEQQRRIMMLWFEIVGLAVRQGEPYRSTVNEILASYEAWIEGKLPPGQAHRARDILAQVEGHMMLNLLADRT